MLFFFFFALFSSPLFYWTNVMLVTPGMSVKGLNILVSVKNSQSLAL